MMKWLCRSIVTLAVFSLAARVTPAAPDVQDQLKEADDTFTFGGEPINPLAVKDLLAATTDRYPGPVAVDLASTHAYLVKMPIAPFREVVTGPNRYFGTYRKADDGTVSIDLKTTRRDEGWFSYKRIGRLTNGLHVLETSENGGGNGTWRSLLLVKFAVDFEYGPDYDANRFDRVVGRDRLVMMRVGAFGLDDSDGAITVRGDTVEISADSNVIKEKTVLRFE
jgi:hypothetical protein